MVIRSKQKELRRSAILDVAERLIRSTGSTDFAMTTLAEGAGVSPATPYNLYGSKDSILYALLTRSLDNIFSNFEELTKKMHALEIILFAGKAAADFFIADSAYYRPLYHFLIGVSNKVHRPAYLDRALDYWFAALKGMLDNGYLTGEHEREVLARQMIIQFLGTLDLWTQEELDDRGFRAHILYGIAMSLSGSADDDWRTRLNQVRMAALEAMPREFSFASSHARAQIRPFR